MALNGKEVLIIDDTADVRLLSRRIVENSGMTALEADSVDAAFALLANRQVNLIMLDLKMPGKSGFDFLQARGAMSGLKQVPVIVVSSDSEKESVFRAIALGASDYIAKPISASTLTKKIRKVLKDTDFMSFQFPKGASPKVTCTTSAVISRPNETGFYLNSPFKLAAGMVVDIASETFKEAGLDTSTFVTDSSPGLRDGGGNYLIRINVAGLKIPVAWAFKKTGS